MNVKVQHLILGRKCVKNREKKNDYCLEVKGMAAKLDQSFFLWLRGTAVGRVCPILINYKPTPDLDRKQA